MKRARTFRNHSSPMSLPNELMQLVHSFNDQSKEVELLRSCLRKFQRNSIHPTALCIKMLKQHIAQIKYDRFFGEYKGGWIPSQILTQVIVQTIDPYLPGFTIIDNFNNDFDFLEEFFRQAETSHELYFVMKYLI